MLRRVRSHLIDQFRLSRDVDHLRFALGSAEARHARSAATMREAEFRAFSQFGEDGIIQWLLARVPIEREVFVEFGVGDYRESNTRFLLEHDNWRGLILDSGTAHLDYLNRSGMRWRHGITARSAFITAENVNELLAEVTGDIGLLAIDIDGVDYWILDKLRTVRARVIVAEYNSLWGPDRKVSVPYDPSFERMKAHWSGLYWGASLAAFCHLLSGYCFIGSNSAGNNAFFVRDDVAKELPRLTAADGWIESKFRDSRNHQGRLTYEDSHRDRRALIVDMPLVDVVTGEPLTVKDLER